MIMEGDDRLMMFFILTLFSSFFMASCAAWILEYWGRRHDKDA